MRRIATYFFILLLLPAIARAQVTITSAGGFSFSYGPVVIDKVSYATSKIGSGRAGVDVDIKLSKRLHACTGLFYALEGFKLTVAGMDDELRLNTFQVPLLLRYKKRSGLFISGGAYIGFSISGRLKNDMGTNDNPIVVGTDVRRVSAGGMAEIGYQFPKELSISFGYQSAFSNLIPENTDGNSFINRQVYIVAGLRLWKSKHRAVKSQI